MIQTLRTRARDAFRLTAMAVAILIRPLAELGLVGDAFVAFGRVAGTVPAILGFSALVLYALYGMMLCIWVGIVMATGLANLLGFRLTGRLPRHMR